MRIEIATIPHNQQRYNTVGDWYMNVDGETLIIKVSDTSISEFNFLIAVHELVEAYTCNIRRVSPDEVDSWDRDHIDSDDPGSLIGCPYFMPHFLATIVEMVLAIFFGVDWIEYEAKIKSISYHYKPEEP